MCIIAVGKGSKFTAALIAIGILLGLATSGWSTIATVPEVPTTSDVVTIVVSGQFGNPCFRIQSKHERQDGTIRVYVIIVPRGEACPAVITPWQIKEVVGILPAGEYFMKAHMTVAATASFPETRSWVEEASFSVQPVLR